MQFKQLAEVIHHARNLDEAINMVEKITAERLRDHRDSILSTQLNHGYYARRAVSGFDLYDNNGFWFGFTENERVAELNAQVERWFNRFGDGRKNPQ